MNKLLIEVRLEPEDARTDIVHVVVRSDGKPNYHLGQQVPRVPYVEERWGRYHEAKRAAIGAVVAALENSL